MMIITNKRILSRVFAGLMCLLLLIVLLPDTAFAANEADQYTNDRVTTTANVNFRSGPGTKYSTIGQVPKGTTVSRIGTDGSWSYVQYNNTEGWISSKYVKEAADSGSTANSSSGTNSITGAKKGTATATGRANVRSGPGTGYKSIGKVTKGTAYDYYEVAGNGWVHINYNGQSGWVSGSYMKIGSGNTTSTGKSNSGSSGSGASFVQANADVNVRSGPGTRYSIVGALRGGDLSVKIGTSGNWVMLQGKDGTVGYVNKSYVDNVKISAVPSSSAQYNGFQIPGNSSGSSGSASGGSGEVQGDYSKGSVYGPDLSTKDLGKVRDAVERALNSCIRDGMSEKQKIIALIDYLCDICKYADSYKGNANNAYGALIEGRAQCSGYARAFKALCDGAGIGCHYVHAAANDPINPNHQWCLVEYKGQWYHIDPQLIDDFMYIVNGRITYPRPITLMASHLKYNPSGLPKTANRDIVLR